MDRQQRVGLIREIEQHLGSRVICYVTGDRENVNTRVAPDIVRVFFQHLEKMGHHPRIDLFLYTRGGDVLTPWRLVNLIREYSPYFGVLVPFRAYSAGTLICLGADEILMGCMGELGPIDPSVANAFNPQDPNNPVARIPVSVEDVFSYLALAREKAALRGEAELVEVFRLLTERVHPLALGNVHRNYALIRSLARKLLLLRQASQPEAVIQEIIDNLTEKLYAHNHMISRREALKDVRLPVVHPALAVEKAMWKLYEGYESYLKLPDPFNPVAILKDHEQQVEFDVIGGIIETSELAHGFVFSGTVARTGVNLDGTPKVGVTMLRQTWQQI
ncbi:hypothetical protein SY88_21520 [Clostridiales bacterium PH28_bin88]|nr:hypothetical protein SY88_21520 [Clostridiales bacterium PH28_bin88]